MASQRNTVISICKALGIILMVIGHADAPTRLHCFLYEFHMPLFFITAGYFFSLKYLTDEATFVKKRIKGLYLPFVKWAVFFLIIHNWMFDLGILNEHYGNWEGGVTHPYSWHQIQQNFWNIITAMAGYDAFLCGAFWFFRGLLVASIVYLIIYKGIDLLCGKTKLPHRETWVPIMVCIFCLLIAGWKTYEGLRVINIIQGGYREIMGTFFFGCGFLFRKYEQGYTTLLHTAHNSTISYLKSGSATLLFGITVYLFSVYLTANMNWRSSYTQFLSLPLPAILGFLMTYNVSSYLNRCNGWLKRFLVFCGDNTLPIFIFHIISFKVVSLIKIAYYNLDPQQIGCHMVIHDYAKEDFFWILYTIAGVGIPLLGTWIMQRLTSKQVPASSTSPSH